MIKGFRLLKDLEESIDGEAKTRQQLRSHRRNRDKIKERLGKLSASDLYQFIFSGLPGSDPNYKERCFMAFEQGIDFRKLERYMEEKCEAYHELMLLRRFHTQWHNMKAYEAEKLMEQADCCA